MSHASTCPICADQIEPSKYAEHVTTCYGVYSKRNADDDAGAPAGKRLAAANGAAAVDAGFTNRPNFPFCFKCQNLVRTPSFERHVHECDGNGVHGGAAVNREGAAAAVKREGGAAVKREDGAAVKPEGGAAVKPEGGAAVKHEGGAAVKREGGAAAVVGPEDEAGVRARLQIFIDSHNAQQRASMQFLANRDPLAYITFNPMHAGDGTPPPEEVFKAQGGGDPGPGP